MFFDRRVYLDYAAGAHGNPSSPHTEGRRAKTVLEEARKEIARLVEVKADDIIFTSGATEANAIAIHGLGKKGTHILYLPSAHASIVENVKMVGARGAEIERLPISNGKIDIDGLKKLLRPETALITMEAVCGETGTIWNTREVGNAVRAHGKNALLHVDASQAPLTQKISRSHFSADLLTLDSSKVGGPRGVGCLIAHRTIPLAPLYSGGGQERGLRPGTEDVEGTQGFAAALGTALHDHESFGAHAAAMRAQLIKSISGITGFYINEGPEVVPHILNISLLGRDTDYLVALLDEKGFAVSTKSACESANGEGSRAVLALTGDADRASTTLRTSFSRATSERDLARFGEALIAAVRFVDSTSAR